MKKIIFLIFIVGQFLAGYAQDLNYLNANFSNVPPTGWTISSDQSASGTTHNWSKSGYVKLETDANDQEEWLISPSFALTAANTYQVRFDYMQDYTTIGTDNDLTLYISFNGGTTWDPVSANADQVWQKSTDGNTGSLIWYASGLLDIYETVDCTAKLAFVFNKTDGDVSQAIDNVVIEENSAVYRSYDFETGLGTAPAVWTILANQANDGSTHTWHAVALTKVSDDPALAQYESLFTNTIQIEDNALASVNLNVEYFSFTDDVNQGCQVWIYPAGEDSVYIGDLNYSASNTREFISDAIDLEAYKGHTVHFELRFLNSAGTDADIYINSFSVDQVFNNGSVEADAAITLQQYDKVVYPDSTKYNGHFAEGFWQVAPHGWTNTGTNAFKAWSRVNDVAGHDYSAQMDTVGGHSLNLNETMTSEAITVAYPAVGAAYVLSFDFRNQTNLNAGPDTDPNLGSAANYDFADVKLEIKIGTGAWTTIWAEDDRTVLDATTSTNSSPYYIAWTGYGDYLLDQGDSWYHADIDISQYLTSSTTSMQIRVNYTGDGVRGGFFNIDNLIVLQTQNPEFELEAVVPYSADDSYYLRYVQVPYTQLDSTIHLAALVKNYGVTSFANANLLFTVDGNVYGYNVVKSSSFASPYPDTALVVADHLASAYSGGVPVVSGNIYNINASGTINGNVLSDDVAFQVTDTKLSRHWTALGYAGDDSISGGRGTIFEIKKTDKIDQVAFRVNNCHDGSQTYLTVIKISDPNATHGTVVYTSPRITLSSSAWRGWHYFTDDFELTPGYYAFMINQTDSYELGIVKDRYPKACVTRGNASHLYTDPDETGILFIELQFVPNEAPEIVTEFANDRAVVFANDELNLTLKATDANGDPLAWDYEVYPTWLASWIEVTDNEDGTVTLSGTPTDADLGVLDLNLIVTDGKNDYDNYPFQLEVVSEMAYFTPDYYESYNNNGLPYGWTVADTDNNGTYYNWRSSGGSATIMMDEEFKQDEWLISPPIFIEDTPDLTKKYTVEFDWALFGFESFCGGNPDVLGSVNSDDNTSNSADVKLMISTDNGITWSAPIWKEDEPELVAPVTDGIMAGQNWGYSDETEYTSIIPIDTSYLGKKIMFAFQFTSNYANINVTKAMLPADPQFLISEFRVLENDETNVWVYTEADYTSIPDHQIDNTNGLELRAYIVNEGQTIPDGSTYDVSIPEMDYYKTFGLADSLFEESDVLEIALNNFVPDTASISSVNLKVKLNINNNSTSGNTVSETSIYRSSNYYSKDYDNDYSDKTFGKYDGLGTIFELNDVDELESIGLNFGSDMNSGVQYSISILKLESKESTTGELIATINDEYEGEGSLLYAYPNSDVDVYIANDEDYQKPLLLQPGIYAIMVNQLDADDQISLYRSDRDYDAVGFIRGNFKALYNEPDDKGYLAMDIRMVGNERPLFTEKSVEDEMIYQGEEFTRNIVVTDENVWGDIFVIADMLPAWLTFVDNGDGTGLLTGNPNDAVPGTYDVSLHANDRYLTTDETFHIYVEPNPAPKFTTTPPAYAVQGAPFTYVADAIDILGEDVVIEADTLVLPEWLDASFDATTNELTLTGTPVAASIGNNVVKLIATDESDMISHQTFDLYVVANEIPEFVSEPSTEAVSGIVYKYYVVATDANENETLAITGTLPTWLALTSTGNGTALLSGTPANTNAGVNNVVLTVTDAAGASSSQTFEIVVEANSAPVVTSTAVLTAREDVLYEYDVVVTDADGDYLYFSTPDLPNFVVFTVNGNGSATLKGIPTQKYVGVNKVTLVVSDGLASTTQTFNITVAEVNDAPVFKSDVITSAEVGKAYSYVVKAIDEEGNALVFNANLPEWLTITDQFDGTALISGTPNVSNIGQANVQVLVSDGALSAQQQYDIVISKAVSVDDNNENGIALYPNPSNGKFRVLNSDASVVAIYTAAGQLVETIDSYVNNQEIDLSAYKAGSYLVKITSASSVVTLPMNLIK